MQAATLKDLFRRIAGSSNEVTAKKLESFIEAAGVGNSFFAPKASLAAAAIMDKLDEGSGAVTWDTFRKRGMALVPPGLTSQLDIEHVAAVVDRRWGDIDRCGTGAVDVDTVRGFIEAQLVAKGASFAGTKADAGARVLMHALDANEDHLLQKGELKDFLMDVATEAKRA
jgi:hypothetical protein